MKNVYLASGANDGFHPSGSGSSRFDGVTGGRDKFAGGRLNHFNHLGVTWKEEMRWIDKKQ